MLRQMCIINSFVVQNRRTFSTFLSKQIIAECYCDSKRICSFTNTLTAATITPPIRRIQRLGYSNTSEDKSLNNNNNTIDLGDEVVKTKLAAFSKMFKCTHVEALEVLEFLSDLTAQAESIIDLRSMNQSVRWLHRSGATLPIIMKNCHLLLIPIDRLKSRFERLNRSKWKQIDDFLPFLAVEETCIKNIQLHHGHVIRNRIYFLNEIFSIESHIISHYCAKHLFIFDMELDLLKQKIEMLINCGVQPDHILRDMSVLARSKEVIDERLELIKKCGIKRVMPWMIKCEDQVLGRSIAIRNQRGTEQNKTLELLTERLNWHGQTANSMFMKNKFLQKLEYDTTSQLLNELLRIFSPDEITANIGLLSHSVAHVKIRVAELKALNKSYDISPKVLDMSDRNFERFLKRVKDN